MNKVGYIYEIAFGWRHDMVGYWVTLVVQNDDGETVKQDFSRPFTTPVHGHAIEDDRVQSLGAITDNILSLMDEAEVSEVSDLLGQNVIVSYEGRRPGHMRILSELK